MYFNPSWSHAHSAFAVSLFLWYWHRTRGDRTLAQWLVLGLLSGLMLDVYYPNAVFLVVPLLESLRGCLRRWFEQHDAAAVRRLFEIRFVYTVAVIFGFLPTLITRQIIYGSPFRFGAYTEMHWHWTSPALSAVLFSSNHGLLVWTPILIPALLGLLFLRRQDPELAISLAVAAVAFYAVISFYPNWDGLSSYGNRFFVSLTPLFILGLAASLEHFSNLFDRKNLAFVGAVLVTGLFVLWNAGFVFQWGTHMVPARGPISWPKMIHNQVAVVPGKMVRTLKMYLLARGVLMQTIEQQDLEELQQKNSGGD